ncbi:hypothetical protein E6R60_25290 [Streptomyces sp. A0642]|uniref:hypothetical protein n=1 Tax=Streptomyces sp. A0642 TaxID=2563100 RepID=UPI0010A23F3C|nr:hypothetical protein [Streptomyces sp. A0642]THA73265.1 hypothetical protein E6R60_25290 [Streptomyces sp. A0642]
MTETTRTTRLFALLVPLFLFLYGVFRLLDGRDGHHGPGPAWNVGHAFFFAAFLLLGALVVELRGLVPTETVRRRAAAGAAMVAGVSGAGCFLWVIAGDLFPRFDDAAPLPELLELVGPLAFQLGILTLLVMLVTARRLPVRSPALVLVAFLLIAVNLDLLPVAALALMAGLAPLARSRPGSPAASANAA